MFEEILQTNTNFIIILRKLSSERGITVQQALILMHVTSGGISMSNLAMELGLDPSTITRNIEKLECKQLIFRQRCTIDSRRVNIYKSKNGQRIGNSIEQDANKILVRLSNRPNTLKNLLQKFNWNLTKRNAKND
ncbi:MAG: hypothetical protein CMG59_02655 [Candidatus Marinimicrobia bacterium]|nr:hypothetical protein [Candidatus Neomarinimicrobiota bacterium]|tara:strand:- start:8645 stop:9049 length:405 start_codon:yes stop_codon:yes gene_type:complete